MDFRLHCLSVQDLRAVTEKRERMEEKELEKIKQKMRLDKLKEQVQTCMIHLYIVLVLGLYRIAMRMQPRDLWSSDMIIMINRQSNGVLEFSY